MTSARALLFCGGLAALAYAGLGWLADWSAHFGTFLLLYLLAWLACWGASRWLQDARWILLGAVLFRTALVAVPPTLSDDVFRYVWEGRVGAAGFDPFVLAPTAPELQHLRDADWSSINNPAATAIYPPLAQLVFRALASVGGVTTFKAAFCCVDLALVALLALGLQRRRAPLRHLALYAWNPLVIVEVAGSGHLEPLALLPLVAALYWVGRRPMLAWSALAASVAVKYAGVLLVPLLVRASRPTARAVAAALGVLALTTLAFASSGSHLFDSLWLYAEKWRYNDALFAALAAALGSLWWAKIVAAAALLVILGATVWRREPLERGALWVLSALVLLSPTIHPWYLLWIVALLPWVPHRALFAWSGSIVFAYWFLYPAATFGPFDKSSWIPRALQWVPVLCVWARGGARVARPAADQGAPPAMAIEPPRSGSHRVALMMPALDEEQALPLVLDDLAALQRTAPTLLDEIIVVDNGSQDRTAAIACNADVTLLHEPVRGYGAACLRAIDYLRARPPDVLVFMDADHSDHAADIPALVRPILANAQDLVIGSRTLGRHAPGALLPQARLGNWLATGWIRLQFGFRYTDLGPFRAVRFATLERMQLEDRDFGWTVEMQVRALQIGARVTEVPVAYRRRVGQSKISGTVSGSCKAGWKILSTLWRLRHSRARSVPAGRSS